MIASRPDPLTFVIFAASLRRAVNFSIAGRDGQAAKRIHQRTRILARSFAKSNANLVSGEFVQQFQNCSNKRFVLDESLRFQEGNDGRLAPTPTTDVEPGGLEKPRLGAWINDV